MVFPGCELFGLSCVVFPGLSTQCGQQAFISCRLSCMLCERVLSDMSPALSRHSGMHCMPAIRRCRAFSRCICQASVPTWTSQAPNFRTASQECALARNVVCVQTFVFFVLRHPCHEPAIAWNSPAITTQILMFIKILTTHGACHALWHRILVSGVIACEGRGPTAVSVQCEFSQESIIGGWLPIHPFDFHHSLTQASLSDRAGG